MFAIFHLALKKFKQQVRQMQEEQARIEQNNMGMVEPPKDMILVLLFLFCYNFAAPLYSILGFHLLVLADQHGGNTALQTSGTRNVGIVSYKPLDTYTMNEFTFKIAEVERRQRLGSHHQRMNDNHKSNLA